ncbi:MAG: zonular occludens toxin domain-containing protein [Georgfuchsia sp.]
MSVTLVTGEPGNGKTALVVKMLTEVKDRPLFTMGIRDLKLDHQPVPPLKEWTVQRPSPEDPDLMQSWFTFPPGALIVIDEAQTVYRPRPNGAKVPDYVAAFETHRHTGVDFILLTQSPGLIDANVRKLLGRHIHIRKTWLGRRKYDWPRLGDPESSEDKKVAKSSAYKPPKEVFHLYKSAELHTKQPVAIPFYAYALAVAVIAFVGLGVYNYQRMTGRLKKPETTQSPSDKMPVQLSQSAEGHIKTKEEYFQQYVPRELGFMHTAPAYDDLTRAQAVPEAIGCYESQRTGCKCLTQQGTTYETTEQVCRTWLAHGAPFKPWKKEEGYAVTSGQNKDETADPAAPSMTGGEPFPPAAVPRYVDAASRG